MTGWLVIGLLGAAAFAAHGVYKGATARLNQHGIHTLTWRFLTGHPWHGKPVTDAGWVRPGRKALTRTGHAPRFHYRPRWQRTVMRTGGTLAVLSIVYGFLVDAAAAILALQAAGGAAAAWCCWRAYRALKRRAHRRAWVEPLHAVCAPLVGIPVANPPRTWLAIEPDRSKAVLALPAGRDFSDPKAQEQLARAASAKLGLEAPDVSWRLGGPEPTLTIRRSEPPPDKVLLADIRREIDESGDEVLVLGLGKGGKPVTVSLAGDSPHLGLSMGSGGGKSVTARLIAAQMAYKGALILNLDTKRISQMWSRGLPNVAYARDDDEIHRALMWLRAEVDRRNRVADAGADVEGRVHANVGPRILVVAEEMNATMKRLRAYWRRVREPGDPVRSPALDALDEVNFTGRQVRVNLLMIGQRLSAEASGGGDSRESLAALIFARHRPSTWRMLVPDLPMPPPTRHTGRAEVVTDTVRTTQVAFLTGAEARELALSGRVAVPRDDMPFTGQPLPATEPQGELPRGPEQAFVTVSPGQNGQPPQIPATEPLTLSAAVAEGILPLSLPAARTARHRDERFPRPVARQGLAHLYDPVELADYAAARSRP